MHAKCTCRHEAQDKWYGQGVRVVNELAKPNAGSQEYRCTVCGRLHTNLVTPARTNFTKEVASA